jgi:polyhydroxyalkanoate synthesis repressor PhaR
MLSFLLGLAPHDALRYHDSLMKTVIKRYQNRKLYDVERSRYVTTGEIGIMIRDGQTIQVLDYDTENDITNTVLANVLKQTGLSETLLHQMIRYGSKSIEVGLDQARRGISELQEDVRQQDMDELEEKIERLERLISELVGQHDETAH